MCVWDMTEHARHITLHLIHESSIAQVIVSNQAAQYVG